MAANLAILVNSPAHFSTTMIKMDSPVGIDMHQRACLIKHGFIKDIPNFTGVRQCRAAISIFSFHCSISPGVFDNPHLCQRGQCANNAICYRFRGWFSDFPYPVYRDKIALAYQEGISTR